VQCGLDPRACKALSLMRNLKLASRLRGDECLHIVKNGLVSMQNAFDLRARSPYFLTTKSSDNRLISARGRQIFNVRPGTSLFPLVIVWASDLLI
jgi:hypothetical protein